MLFKSDIIKRATAVLKERAVNIPIVFDPVTLAKSDDPLLLPEAISTLTEYLIPLAKACELAKNYLHQAILTAKDNSVGKGHSPVYHFFHIWPKMTHNF